jgi:GcrA cell cycle regulator
MVWSDERIAELKEKWANRVSAALIAAEFQTSRNSILGKINRLGLSRPRWSGKPRPIVPTDSAERNRKWRERIRQKASGFIASPWRESKLARTPPKPRPVITEPLPETRVSVFDVTDHQCRWPCFEGDEPIFDKFYCGAVSLPQLPYCAWHAKQAYARRS